MKIYNIGYYSYEESQYWQFYHEEDYTEKQLNKIVFECLWEGYLVEKEKNSKFEWAEDQPISYSDMFGYGREVFCEEMEKRGFKQVEYAKTVSMFGWSSPESSTWGSNSKDPVMRSAKRFFKKKIKELKNGKDGKNR